MLDTPTDLFTLTASLHPSPNSLTYEERIKSLKLPTVKERVLRGDLIEAYKILTGKTGLDPAKFFEKNEDERTRGHHLKLKAKRAAHVARAKFFSLRVVNAWNGLPEEVISAETVNMFKRRLDQYWDAVILPEPS